MQDPKFMKNGGSLRYMCEHLYPFARADVKMRLNCFRGRDAAFLSATQQLGLQGEIITWDDTPNYHEESWRSFPFPGPDSPEQHRGNNALKEQAGSLSEGTEVHVANQSGSGAKEGNEIIEDMAFGGQTGGDEGLMVADGATQHLPFDKSAAIIVQIPKFADRDILRAAASSWAWLSRKVSSWTCSIALSIWDYDDTLSWYSC